MKVRIDRIIVRGVPEAPDGSAFEAAVRAELATALRDVAAPGRPVHLVQATAPHGTAPAPAIAAAVRSVLGGAP